MLQVEGFMKTDRITKKVDLVFRVLLVLLAAAAVVHAVAVYLFWVFSPNYSSSAPKEVVFLLAGLGYGLAIVCVLLVWLCVRGILKQAQREGAKTELWCRIVLYAAAAAAVLHAVTAYLLGLFVWNEFDPYIYLLIAVGYGSVCVAALLVWMEVRLRKRRRRMGGVTGDGQ